MAKFQLAGKSVEEEITEFSIDIIFGQVRLIAQNKSSGRGQVIGFISPGGQFVRNQLNPETAALLGLKINPTNKTIQSPPQE